MKIQDTKTLKDSMYEGSQEGLDILLLAFTEFLKIFEEAEDDLCDFYSSRLEELLGHNVSFHRHYQYRSRGLFRNFDKGTRSCGLCGT